MPNLGDDNVHIYSFNETDGILNPESPVKVNNEEGTGPRFMDFHSSGKFAYLGLEFGNQIEVYSVNETTGALTTINIVSTLPEGYTTGKTAQVHVSPDDKFVYISNRGHNSIAAFVTLLC